MANAKVAIIMGSSSDLSVMEGALEALKQFDISYEVKVVSAHRTPQGMLDFAKSAKERGIQVIIAGAGGAAHLPGMVASATTLPVIGVPVNSKKSVEGIDSLLSIVQMPAGIPVATMAIDGSFNAGLYAVRIMGINDKQISQKLDAYEKSLAAKVDKMNQELNK